MGRAEGEEEVEAREVGKVFRGTDASVEVIVCGDRPLSSKLIMGRSRSSGDKPGSIESSGS